MFDIGKMIDAAKHFEDFTARLEGRIGGIDAKLEQLLQAYRDAHALLGTIKAVIDASKPEIIGLAKSAAQIVEHK